MRIRVVGSGIAGTLLAWRLAQHDVIVELQLGPARHVDATAVSGGIIRRYEPTAEQRELAVGSLRELAADARIRQWARYRPVSSTWLVSELDSLRDAADQLERDLPGSVELLSADDLRDRGWSGVPAAGGALVERHGGYFEPDALRSAVLDDMAGRANVNLRTETDPGRCDLTVVAAGAWTPGLLARMGMSVRGYRTKTIQYAAHRTGSWRPGPFADAITGLYGRPTTDGLLLGLPTADWDVDPTQTRVNRSLVDRAAELAAARFPQLELGSPLRQVSAADCYCEPALLSLRPAGVNTYTFTGGSGGAAKSALAASSRAATALLRNPSRIGQLA